MIADRLRAIGRADLATLAEQVGLALAIESPAAELLEGLVAALEDERAHVATLRAELGRARA